MEFQYASDQALQVSLGDGITLQTHHRVRKLVRLLQAQPVPGVCNLHPAYCSVLIRFNPLMTDHATVERAVRERGASLEQIELPQPRIVEIPVEYGGQAGPDLPDVAKLSGLSVDEVVRRHSEARYLVYFLGFVPGFAYLGGLPDAIAVPRLPAPRKCVEAGSVGIAGSQTGVYPVPTPGGWRLIGRTPLTMFSATREPGALLALGDEVRFRPV